MKKWLIRIAAVIAVVVAAFAVIGLLLPTTYQVVSTTTIEAPRDTVHALIADLEQWERWEPWREGNASVVITLGDQTTGVGANQSWTEDSGDGRLVFTQSDPAQGIAYDMWFGDFPKATATLHHEPIDGADGTIRVTWTMDGDTGVPVIGGYIAKLMPGMIEPMFDRGLEKLKAAAEDGSASPDAAGD